MNDAYHVCINLFQGVYCYLRIRAGPNAGTDLFCLLVYHGSINLRESFKRSSFRKIALGKIVNDSCIKKNNSGYGSPNLSTKHSLRESMSTASLGAGYSDSSVLIRKSHGDPRSLKIYQHLIAIEGVQQQCELFNTPG